MPKYTHRTKDGQPCRRVLVEHWLTEAEEKRISQWAKARGQTLKQWLQLALRDGIEERAVWDRENTDD